MTDNARIIANLRRAIELVTATPETRLNLSLFKQETPCGTLFCAAGLLATDQHFQAQGMHLAVSAEHHGMRPFWVLQRIVNGIQMAASYDWSWLDGLFGENAFDNLFAEYGEGWRDGNWLPQEWFDSCVDEKPITDKELILSRLSHQLELYEEPASHA